MACLSRGSRLARIAICAGSIFACEASAVPVLQLYIEGATYDSVEESWYYPGHEFRLWAIGNLSGPGGTGGAPIRDVRLSAVYDDPGKPVTITITPARIGGTGSYNGFTDAAAGVAPVLLRTVADGSLPEIGGGRFLPSHGEYGAGKVWQEFGLGVFNTADAQSADFVHDFPAPGAGITAQINAYDVRVEGADAHFDLYGLVDGARGRISYIFAPPSHDATDGPVSVPVPATLPLLGIGGLGLSALARRQGKRDSSSRK